MKPVKYVVSVAAFAAASSISVVGYAQRTTSAASANATAADMAEGEVRKIDKENRKITLKHGEINSLDMPPMTMVFQVSDPAMLDKVKPGEKVRFRAVSEGGKMTVTEIQPVK